MKITKHLGILPAHALCAKLLFLKTYNPNSLAT